MALRVETRTLGDVFLERKKELDAAMEASRSEKDLAVLNLSLDAGVEIGLALVNMQTAYSTLLTTLQDKVNANVKSQLHLIGNMIASLQLRRSIDQITSIPKRLQELVKTLPLEKQTKLSRVTVCPLSGCQSRASELLVKCEGFFPHATRYCPSMRFHDGGIRYPDFPAASILVFAHALKFEPDRPFCVPVTLRIFNETGYVRWVPMAVDYPIWLKIPPLVIGELITHFISAVDTGVKKECETPIFTLKGDIDHPSQWIETDYRIRPDPGWMISTVEPRIHEGTTGSYKILYTHKNNEVRLKVGLAAEAASMLSLLHFSVKYTQMRGQIKQEKSVAQLKAAFEWGDTMHLEINPLGKRVVKVVLNTRDGASYTFFRGISSAEPLGFFPAGQAKNPYLSMKLEKDQEILTISTQCV